MIAWGRQLWARFSNRPAPEPQHIPQTREATPAPTAAARPKSGRPISSSLARAIDALSKNPALTSAELAALLRVTPSYGRTLLRRARARMADPAGEAAPAGAADIGIAVAALEHRLAAAEKALATVRATPLHVRASLDLNRRAEVLRLLGNGVAPETVAERLAIPCGEVEFIRKIDTLLASCV